MKTSAVHHFLRVNFTIFLLFLVLTACSNTTSSIEKESTAQTLQLEDEPATPMPSEPTPTPTHTEEPTPEPTIRPEDLNGRGWSDVGREEPEYKNISGYVVIDYDDYELAHTDDFPSSPWYVPIYEKDKQFYTEIGTVEHKTEVIVKDQELEHEGHGAYSGYLLVESIETGDSFYIDVGNFLTKPYWTYSPNEAVKVGYYIAELNQVSDYYPVSLDNEKVELEDGTLVLVTGRTGTYGRGRVDNDTHPIEGIVFKQWKYGYGSSTVYFTAADLTVIY